MSLMDFYWTLASDNPDERVNAAESLLKALETKKNEDDWNYALKRLVRGLSSSRGSARLGFSMALSELLQLRASHISISQYLTLCDQSFQISGNMKGAEERGLLLGRLFALQTLAKSSLWESEHTGSDDLLEFSTMVVELSLNKAWLREPPFFALCGLVSRLSKVEKFQEGLNMTFQLVREKGLSISCEGVALALSVSKDQRMKFNTSQDWELGDPTHTSNLNQLRRTLKEMPVIAGDVSSNKPYIHFVWSLLLPEYCNPNCGEEPNAKKRKLGSRKVSKLPIAEFWNLVVDKDFFGPETSSERKMWGFEIFLLWASNKELPEVAPLISPNFVKTLAIQLAQKDRNLHKICKKVQSLITNDLPAQRPEGLLEVISKFMSLSPNFDKISKSKLVSSLLISIPYSTIPNLVSFLLKALEEPGKTVVDKQWVLDNLVVLVKNALNSNAVISSASPAHWIGDIFKALIPLAYFVPISGQNERVNTGKENVNPTEADVIDADDEEHQEKDMESTDRLAKVAQDRVMSILSLTLGKNTHLVSPDPQSSWPYVVVQLIMKFNEENTGYEPRVEFDEITTKSKAKVENTLHKIHKKRNSSRHVDSPQLQAFELLFAMVLLQIYGLAPDAVSMLDELQMCYHKINRNSKAQNEGEGGLETEVEDPSIVLTEILISLLSQHSIVLRKLSEDVWRAFSDQFSEGSLSLLCDILGVQEGTEGQRFLFDVEDGDDEDEDEDDDGDEVDDDDEEEDEENDDDPEEDEEEEDVGDENPSDYELDDVAKKELAGTLGVDHSKSDNDDASSEESMDDEQMSALDVHLTTIFRERRKQQSKAKELRTQNSRAKQNITQLKNRVLDLLEIYFTAQPSNLVGISCIEPLLKFIQQTKETRLAEKARELLKTRLCRKTNYVLANEDSILKCLSLLRAVHSLAAESKTKVLTLACNQVSVFLSKLIIAFDAVLVTAVSNVYNTSLQQWFTLKGNQTSPNLFIDFVNFLSTVRKSE